MNLTTHTKAMKQASTAVVSRGPILGMMAVTPLTQ